MATQYWSTRDPEGKKVTASQAILNGLAPDGGLYLPVELPHLDFELTDLPQLSYQELALKVLAPFLSDFTTAELRECIKKAYGDQFDDERIAPVSWHAGNGYLELFHGPTLAFKDLALQLMPHLMVAAAKKNDPDHSIVILTATSGDTGKAAMEGFADVPGTKIIVFYPEHGVSPIQRQQMLTQRGKNTFAIGIDGNFDDAQTNVKKIFRDPQVQQTIGDNGYRFSSANSINIGRLLPQIVYYFSAYGQLMKAGKIRAGDFVNFSVPTGNFGDIFAGYLAKQLGLPVNKLICASNENNVLTEFFRKGVYDVKDRDFHVTSSPSMDILVSSNLERLLFYALGQNANKTTKLMKELQEKGVYQIDQQTRDHLVDFYAGFATQTETAEEIKRVYRVDHAVLDPHTAVGSFVAQRYQAATKDDHQLVVLSTASPLKFPQAVLPALGDKDNAKIPGIEAIPFLASDANIPIPDSISRLFNTPSQPEQSVEPDQMAATVLKILQ